MTQPVFRFAPSPNGRLHRGHAFSALLNQRLARAWEGRLLLRVENIDVVRCRPELEAGVLEDLAWLGLSWERPVRRQSEHFTEYLAAAETLKGRGLLYPCFCTRRAIVEAVEPRDRDGPWPRDPDGVPLYPGLCRTIDPEDARRRMDRGEPHAWRLRCEGALAACPGPHAYKAFDLAGAERVVAADPARWGDAVILRKEVPASYHLAVVHDDALQGVTHVVRGRDLEAATDLHVLLQALLRLPMLRYHHHGLILDGEGDKLSKSLGSEALSDLRARGVTAGEVIADLRLPPIPPPGS